MSNLTVSDWVTFLSSERDVAFNTVLNFGAVLIAFVGLVFATRTVGTWQVILEAVVTIAFAMYAFYKIFTPFGKRGRVSEQILNKIISGKLNSADDIQKEWLAKK